MIGVMRGVDWGEVGWKEGGEWCSEVERGAGGMVGYVANGDLHIVTNVDW